MRLVLLVLAVPLIIARLPHVTADENAGVPVGPAMVALSWGYNGSGELGDDNMGTNRSTPGIVKGAGGIGILDDLVAISGGSSHALALASDGTVWAWGSDLDGMLGDGPPLAGSDVPVQVLDATGAVPLDHIVAIAAGAQHSVALKDDGTVWAWGRDADGQLGDGLPAEDKDLPVQVKNDDGSGFLTDVIAVAAGYDHTVAIRMDGSVWAWGADDYGQLGDGPPAAGTKLPVRVKDATGLGSLGGVKAVAAGKYHTLALGNDGRVWAWGFNNYGEVGDGTEGSDRPLPVQVKNPAGDGPFENVTSIAAGTHHSLAIRSDGSAWSWGLNDDGQLGNSDIGVNRKLPGPVFTSDGPLTGIVSIAGAFEHSLAVSGDGSAWAWGIDDYGTLGDGAPLATRDEAVQVQGFGGPLRAVVAISAGIDADSSYALARTATAALIAPGATRSPTVGVQFAGASVFGVDGYFIGESPVPPSVMSADWKSTPPVAYTIQSPGDGVKTLYAFTRDAEGYVSPPATAKVRLDTAAPSATFDVPPFTGGKRTKVQLSGSDAGGVTGYMIKANATRPSPDAPGWKVRPPTSFPLSGADGPKKLFAWTKDAAGNVSATKSDTTLLDTEAPGVRIDTPGRDAKLARLRSISGRTEDGEPASGVKRQRAAIQRRQGTACSWWDVKAEQLVAGPCNKPKWFAVPGTTRWTKEIGELDAAGSYTLYVEAVDRALNRERVTRRFEISSGGALGPAR